MPSQTERLEIATVKAEIASDIISRFSNDAVDADPIPTDSGDIDNLKKVVEGIEDKASISTTIFQTTAAGLAATPEGGMFLVASADNDEIYVVWRKVSGSAVDTGKRTLNSQAVQDAATDAASAAASAEESASLALTAQSQLPTVPQFEAIQTDVNALKLDPANGVTSWTIQAKSFDLVQGVPTYGAITGRLAAWQFPLDTAAYVSMPVVLPSHWNSMDIYAQWVNQVANSGNVVLGGEIHQWAMGETINTTPVGGSGIFSANASPWIPQESKIAADLAVTPSKNTTIRIARQGASGSDTLPNSMAILAVRLVKKS